MNSPPVPDWVRGIPDEDEPKRDDHQDESSDDSLEDLQSSIHSNQCHEDFGLYFFQTVNLLIILNVCLMAMSNVWAFFTEQSSAKVVALRIYSLAFCAVIVMTELDVNHIEIETSFMGNWVFRGMFIIFTGLMELHSNTNIPLETEITIQKILISACLVTFGLLYIFMGMLCMKHIKEECVVVHNHRRNRRRHILGSVEIR